MTDRKRWLVAGLLAAGLISLVVPALVWAKANEPAASSAAASAAAATDSPAAATASPAAAEGPETKAVKTGSPAKPAKSLKRISGFTEEREAAAMTFVRMNHPELATLLDQLKLNDIAEYQRAIRELFHSSEKLADLQERNSKRYPMELEAWKLNSRIRLLVARLTMSPDPKIEDELRQALLQQIGLRKAALNDERERLETRVTELKEQLQKLDKQQTMSVEQRMARLLSDASRSHSELKAANKGGSKKKKSEKRAESETSSPSKSNDE